MNLRDIFFKDVKGFPPSEPNELISRPLKEGFHNSLIAVAGGAIAALLKGTAHQWYPSLSGLFFKIVAVTVLVVIFLSFGHAYLGSRIGGRRATNVVKAIVYTSLILSCIIYLIGLR